MDMASDVKKSKRASADIINASDFMTAKVQQEEVERYENLGTINVTTKPFGPISISSEIEKIWVNYHD